MTEPSTSPREAPDREPEQAPGEPAPGVPAPDAAAPPGKSNKLQQLMMEYGVIAVIVLLSLSALSYLGFFFAFMVGFEVEGAGGTAGASAAALAGWVATKPFRIPLAIALTPVVAAIWRRLRGRAKHRG
ncbi:hypothetical protein [Paraliomyxa miuraensis]|uniref:hypothetical protein n=1 Tax=Paraliomyxa miuraensis TaxID=376150 RepID=UPI00224D019D|nr:hypothetical protein [Paraliomyxa miuraensis]MCX4243767.1 hypothetical protein [Paraliomyxa miuraensis]